MVGGVDTHLDEHVAAALDERGGLWAPAVSGRGSNTEHATSRARFRVFAQLRELARCLVVQRHSAGCLAAVRAGPGHARPSSLASLELIEGRGNTEDATYGPVPPLCADSGAAGVAL